MGKPCTGIRKKSTARTAFIVQDFSMKTIPLTNRVPGASFASAIISAICIGVMAGGQSLAAATLVVTSTADSGAGSLRNTIDAANPGDTIEFSSSIWGQTIILTSGELVLVRDVIISGPGPTQMHVTRSAAAPAFRIFDIISGLTVTIEGLTISNGLTTSGGGAIYNVSSTLFVSDCVFKDNSAGHGGAIFSGSDGYVSCWLGVENSTFEGNSASGAGGAIFNDGAVGPDPGGGATASIYNSKLSHNSAQRGGAIMTVGASAALYISGTTVSGNLSQSYGGGIFNTPAAGGGPPGGSSSVSISDSTISGNSAASGGGGIWNTGLCDGPHIFPGSVAIINSTVSDNMAGSGSGGGIGNYTSYGGGCGAAVSINSSTISGNSAATGGGISNNNGGVSFGSTVLKHGSAGSNLVNDGGEAIITSAGYNLSSDSTGPAGDTDRLNVNPRLGSLQDNGGPTFTHALLPGSPAIDAGNPSFSPPPEFDQRGPGFARIVNGHVDIGSFELQTPAPALTPDFNSDGKIDYLLQNANTRQTARWLLNDNVYLRGFFGPTLPVGWNAIDTADFNLDRETDYTLFNPTTRQTAIWYLNRGGYVSGRYGPTLPNGWQLMATADFNGDIKPDYVLYNASTRQTAVWYMNNNLYIGGSFGPTLPGWRLAGVADFNRDGETDYALFNPSTRQTAIYYLSGTVYINSVYGPTVPGGYELKGVADFDGDGKPDYVVYNPSTRRTVIWYLNNNVYIRGALAPILPIGWSLTAP
jgi:predicted outer membrane repeat protein